MLTFPNAKINLGLNITEKRPDGYHNLETIFYPVPIEDALEINILNEGNGKFRLHQAGLEIELILLCHSISQTLIGGTGISTCCPSPTPFGLGLGPD